MNESRDLQQMALHKKNFGKVETTTALPKKVWNKMLETERHSHLHRVLHIFGACILSAFFISITLMLSGGEVKKQEFS